METVRRNVADQFSHMSTTDVVEFLNQRRHPYTVVMENFESDFNFASLVRNANAFLASEVFYVGPRRWDRRGAVGTHLYTKVTHLTSMAELGEHVYGPVVAFDNVAGAEDVNTFSWPKNAVMLFGSESNGLCAETLALADHVVHIPQYGSVRSINAAAASAVAMNSWCAQHGQSDGQDS